MRDWRAVEMVVSSDAKDLCANGGLAETSSTVLASRVKSKLYLLLTLFFLTKSNLAAVRTR